MDLYLHPISNLLQAIIQETQAENQRRHEKKIQELQLIANSDLRDKYVEQLVLDRFLAPVEDAQHKIQNAAKHAQYMAEVISYYYSDHNLSKQQAKEVCQQFRFLAIRITQIDSLIEFIKFGNYLSVNSSSRFTTDALGRL